VFGAKNCFAACKVIQNHTLLERLSGGSKVFVGVMRSPSRLSSLYIKSPSIMLTWQNTVLLSSRVHHSSIICRNSGGLRPQRTTSPGDYVPRPPIGALPHGPDWETSVHELLFPNPAFAYVTVFLQIMHDVDFKVTVELLNFYVSYFEFRGSKHWHSLLFFVDENSLLHLCCYCWR